MLQLWISETPISLVLVTLTAGAFLAYGIQVFVSQRMNEEYLRYGVSAGQKRAIGSAQILGACGLLIGVIYPVLGLFAAIGFVVMMLGAVTVRFKIKDSLSQALPALILLGANVWLCISYYSWMIR